MLFRSSVPLSEESETVGEAAVVSSVKLKLFEPDVFPAISVWRTRTVFAPSPETENVDPVPVVHVEPAFVLYSHVAPLSIPSTLTVPAFVTLSLPSVPLSDESETVGESAVVSSVKLKLFEADVFPATSVWRTRTVDRKSTRLNSSHVSESRMPSSA